MQKDAESSPNQGMRQQPERLLLGQTSGYENLKRPPSTSIFPIGLGMCHGFKRTLIQALAHLWGIWKHSRSPGTSEFWWLREGEGGTGQYQRMYRVPSSAPTVAWGSWLFHQKTSDSFD